MSKRRRRGRQDLIKMPSPPPPYLQPHLSPYPPPSSQSSLPPPTPTTSPSIVGGKRC